MLNSRIKLLKTQLVHKSAMRNGLPPGYAISQSRAKMGVPLQVYTLNYVISVVKWQQAIYNDHCIIYNRIRHVNKAF